MREDLVAVAAVVLTVEGPDVDHLGFGEDARTLFLGEIEIVLVEGVFGVVAAAHHAASAADAGVAVGTFSLKVGIGRGRAGLLAILAEEDGDLCGVESVGHARGGRHLFQLDVRRAEDGVGDNAHHALGGLVMRGHDALPVVETGPRAVLPDAVRRLEHGVGVRDGAAAYSVAVQDDDVAEEADIEEPSQTEFGFPEVAAKGPVCFGEIFRRPAAAHLDDENLVALFREPQS